MGTTKADAIRPFSFKAPEADEHAERVHDRKHRQ